MSPFQRQQTDIRECNTCGNRYDVNADDGVFSGECHRCRGENDVVQVCEMCRDHFEQSDGVRATLTTPHKRVTTIVCSPGCKEVAEQSRR